LKLSRIFAEYLIQNKRLNLQGLGFFTIDETILKTPEQESAGIRIIPGSVQFHLDKNMGPDEKLIEFISKETGKIRPLATSDLESYLELGKQLININKPFILEGVGTLQKNGQNQLEFIQGDAFSGQPELQGKKPGRLTEDDIHFDDNYLKPVKKIRGNFQTLVVILLLLVGLAIIVWVVFYFYNKSSQAETDTNIPNVANQVISKPVPDTTNKQIIPDTTTTVVVPKDTVSRSTAQPIPLDPGSFKLVLEISGHNRAMKRYAELKEYGHNIQMNTTDSVRYKLFIPLNAPLSDSIRHRDSLSRFFGRKVWIETN
jgi:hypothetical protein